MFVFNILILSRPTRARGLKQGCERHLYHRRHVAPHAGAWIETFKAMLGGTDTVVAPHAGAWIETSTRSCPDWVAVSRPTRARGLKPDIDNSEPTCAQSRPTRARGLKLYGAWGGERFYTSRPTRARGLKPVARAKFLTRRKVAPHAGAWIETGQKLRR